MTRFSLQPSRCGPPKSSAVRSACCSMVPMAPSRMRMRSRSSSRRAKPCWIRSLMSSQLSRGRCRNGDFRQKRCDVGVNRCKLEQQAKCLAKIEKAMSPAVAFDSIVHWLKTRSCYAGCRAKNSTLKRGRDQARRLLRGRAIPARRGALARHSRASSCSRTCR